MATKNPNKNTDLIWKNPKRPNFNDGAGISSYLEKYDENCRALEALNREAEKRGCLQGRIIYEPFADGYATYQVVKENKASCRIRHVCVGGDDWRIPYWGDEVTVKKGFVISAIMRRMVLDYAFDKSLPKPPKVFVDGYGQKWE